MPLGLDNLGGLRHQEGGQRDTWESGASRDGTGAKWSGSRGFPDIKNRGQVVILDKSSNCVIDPAKMGDILWGIYIMGSISPMMYS